jgi:hypothetical protein
MREFQFFESIIEKVFFYYPNNAHTTEILKPGTISNDLKKNISIIKYKCHREK